MVDASRPWWQRRWRFVTAKHFASPRPRPHALILVLTGLTLCGCAVRRTTRLPLPQRAAAPAKEASAADLIARLNSWSGSIQTLTATVDLQPTAGSVYSGIINEYHDVKSFIFIEKPAMIRMIGQAPVVRTNIFDMVSDGEEFRLYIPLKQKFYVGKNVLRRPAKNALENLRPQHILDALLIPPVDSAPDQYAYEQAEEGGRRYYVLTLLERPSEREFLPKQKVWFDRADLEIARLQLYAPQGVYIENVLYSDYRDFQGIRYPARIQVIRPVEDYSLSITIVKATFNEAITREKFQLNKPAGAQLVELSAVSGMGGLRGH